MEDLTDSYLRETLSVNYIRHYGDDQTPVDAARVSTLSHSGDEARDLKLARYLLAHGHTSPFEHMGATFLISCPIFAARQIMRHRTCSFNEVSRRYTSRQIAFYLPKELHSQHPRALQCSEETPHPQSAELLAQIEEHQRQSLKLYCQLITGGVAREEARGVLPLNTMTQFYMSANLLNWLRFLKLRTDHHTQAETRYIANAIRLHLSLYFPKIMLLAQELWISPSQDKP